MDRIYEQEATLDPRQMDLESVYIDQVGHGMALYAGHRYMRGSGFFGRLLKSGLVPLVSRIIPYLKSAALPAVSSFTRDIADGMSVKEAGKRTLKRSAAHVLDEVSEKLKQDGGGIITGKKIKGRRPFRDPKPLFPVNSEPKPETKPKSKLKVKRQFSEEHKRKLRINLEKANRTRFAKFLNDHPSPKRTTSKLFKDV